MYFFPVFAALLTVATAQLSKPVINPPFEGGGLNSLHKGLEANLPLAKYKWDHWVTDRLPEACRDIAEQAKNAGYSAKDVHAFSIKYDDCPDRWHFCRHENAELSAERMIRIFGRMPVHMRQWVRHMIALPSAGTGNNALNYGSDDIKLNGKLGTTVFVHEIGHSLDRHAFYGGRQLMSSSQRWLDAYNADAAVPDEYALTNQLENFAQNVVVALFNANVPGGVGTVQPAWRQITHQYHLIQDLIPGTIHPGGVCSHRFRNSPAVPKTGPKFASAMAEEEEEPYQELSNEVIVAEHLSPESLPETVEVGVFDDDGNFLGTETEALD